LRDDLRAHQSIVTRFSREAQAAARLDHPNIVQIFSVGAAERTPYIAMEFVDALPLSAVMQREHRLEWGPALEIAKQIAAALACAHDSHVIHRDVKPPNILLDDHQRAYVTDFGIAKILTLDDNLTVDGTRLGTPHYMAPERCKNGEVTASSDLYSLGVLTFQMLTGRLPYEASTPVAMMQRIIAEPPARVRKYVPDIPEDVERLVAWLMEMNPKHRPESGHAVCEAIDRVLAGHPLDIQESRSVAAIQEFRKDLASDTSSNRTTVSDANQSARFRRGLIIGVGIAMLIVAGSVLWRVLQPVAPPTATARPEAWFEAASVAEFGNEGENVILAEFQLNGYDLRGIFPAGADGQVAVMLERSGAGAKQVLATVSPLRRDANIQFVAAPQSHFAMMASASGLSGSLFDGYGLVRANERTALVSLREPSAPIQLSDTLTQTSTVAMHPAGSQWVSAETDSSGNAILVGHVYANGQTESRTIAPAGAPVVAIQYSKDGQYLAYVRETTKNDFSLRVIPAGGVDSEPAPLRSGDVAISAGAFNMDASAILLSTGGATPRVEAISAADGRTLESFDDAARGAWDPRRGDVILTARDAKGVLQLWRVNSTAERDQLTFLDNGTDEEVLVSPDGVWAASHTQSSEKPSMVFVQLVD
ncbi:MAG: serine/threonine protein kinase, partial [Candidatus Hydrogenedentes bacterium]|nr:serine/threonine protein kinase [Candidatus Hydrogenedentota bacterium]